LLSETHKQPTVEGIVGKEGEVCCKTTTGSKL
jgi:primary-amine oxidase